MTTVSGTSSVDSIRTDYLNLLITQLRYQNPLEPMDNNEMSMQLAQLSQLEQLENMSSTFQGVLLAEQTSQASGLMGKEVTFYLSDEESKSSGVVDGVEIYDGEVRLKVGDHTIGIGDVQTITEQSGT